MDIKSIKVKNMQSSNGNEIPNQFIIRVKTTGSKDQVMFDEVYFQSYDSIIAKVDFKGNVTLDETYWNYSNTTGKYRNIFLREERKETERKIESGEYELANLN